MSDETRELRGALPDTTNIDVREEVFEALFGGGEPGPGTSPDAEGELGDEPHSGSWVRRLRARVGPGRGDLTSLPTDPRTLRFRDAGIEADYRRKLVPRVRAQLRSSLISSLVMWPVGGTLAWALAPDGRSLLVAVPLMVVFLAVLLAVERRTERVEGLTWNGALSNAVPGLLNLVICVYEGVFPSAGPLLSVLVMAFGFTLLNLPFSASVWATTPYTLGTVGLLLFGPEAPLAGFQAFLVLMSFGVLASGAYARESAARRDFFLTRVIADQERELEEERARRLGEYTLEAELGRGGMGVVHRARHSMLRRPTAIKILSIADAKAEDLARFEQEVQFTSELSHPNIVAIYDYGRSHGGEFYYAMEYVAGLDLQSLVESQGPVPAERAVPILKQICDALHEAHARGLVHRDIKPGNVLVARIGTRCDAVKVVDFGLVQELGADAGASPGMAGTPAYLSPEVIRDPGSVGPAADIYALGALAFFLLTGQRAMPGQTIAAVLQAHLEVQPTAPSELAPGPVPPELDALVLAALSKKPEARPSAAEMAAALEGLDLSPPQGLEQWWDDFDVDRKGGDGSSGSALTLTVAMGTR